MPQEIIGEATIRSTQPRVIAGSASANIPGLLSPDNLLAGPITIRLSGDGREIMLGGDATESGALIHLDGSTGNITVRDRSGRDILRFDNRFAVLDVGGTENEGDVRVRNNADAVTIHLDGNAGDIRLLNADVAEDFDVCSAEVAEPGTVMVLEGDGQLHPSTRRNDSRVVGVVAGGGEFKPGMILDRKPSDEEVRAPISIMGKTSVKAVTENGAIKVGELLTSSSTSGRATSVGRAPVPTGAVIGKALTPLAKGTGMVDMLVTLR